MSSGLIRSWQHLQIIIIKDNNFGLIFTSSQVVEISTGQKEERFEDQRTTKILILGF